MSEHRTLIQLIALNGKDFGVVAQEYLSPPKGKNINHIQARMIGWATLLHQQTGRLLDGYEVLPANPEFQGMVEKAFKYYIEEGKENTEEVT